MTDVRLVRTVAHDPDFLFLVAALDKDLRIRNGEEDAFYASFNKPDASMLVVLAYTGSQVVGCGALKPYSGQAMEVKRMYVLPTMRGQGIASRILKALEHWCWGLGFSSCILETGKKQPEAIALYTKGGYSVIPNYGQYQGVENSVCFGKELLNR